MLRCDNTDGGCCFCDRPSYKTCTLCGHLVCMEHVGSASHLCAKKVTKKATNTHGS